MPTKKYYFFVFKPSDSIYKYTAKYSLIIKSFLDFFNLIEWEKNVPFARSFFCDKKTSNTETGEIMSNTHAGKNNDDKDNQNNDMSNQKIRTDGRKLLQLRPIVITPHVSEYAEGSVMIEFGKTKVLVTATYEAQGPKWLQGSGQGWITAEYGMLPRATHQRVKRDKNLNSGRTQEISRLIGRSLRAAVNLKALGEKQITVDCDVINADGGTRTASVTGGFVALALALKKLHTIGEIKSLGLQHYVSAISVGFKEGQAFLDMNYEEDSNISTDMNFVMTDQHKFIEVQGTAEQQAFSKTELVQLLEVAEQGCQQLFIEQEKCIGSFFPLLK